MRDVEPVVAAKAEEEVVARDLGDGLRLEAEQLADPVVLVHDEVVGAQVGEGLERAASRTAPGITRRTLAEDLRVGQQDEPEVSPDEAAARGRDGEEELRLVGQGVTRLEQARLDPAEQVRRAQRLTAVGKGDDDAVSGADEAGQLGLGLGEPAGGDCRPLRLEGERLPARERVELRCTAQRQLRLELLGPDLAYLLGLPDQVGRPVERPHQIARDPGLPAVVGKPRLPQVEPALGRRVDDRAPQVAQRPLRERREGPDRLDLVAEELDPDRIAAGRRENVDEPAADCELPALLHAVDPLVPGQGQLLGDRVETGRGAGFER